jgi:FMN phosphatase YigB (HAD superfamily)
LAKRPPTPRIVLFDLGGVLLPFDRERRVRTIAERLKTDPQPVRELFGGELVRRMDLGQADENHFAAAFSRMAGGLVTPGLARALLLSAFEEPNMPLWRSLSILKRETRVGCFSDNPTFVRELFPDPSILEPAIFSSEIGCVKPSPEAFAAAEALVDACGEAILFIDDSNANVAAARARGWDAICFSSNQALAPALAQRGFLAASRSLGRAF